MPILTCRTDLTIPQLRYPQGTNRSSGNPAQPYKSNGVRSSITNSPLVASKPSTPKSTKDINPFRGRFYRGNPNPEFGSIPSGFVSKPPHPPPLPDVYGRMVGIQRLFFVQGRNLSGSLPL